MARRKRAEGQEIDRSQSSNLEEVFMNLSRHPGVRNVTLDGKLIELAAERGHEDKVCVQVFVHKLFFLKLGLTGDVRVWYMVTPWKARGENELEAIIQMKCRMSFTLPGGEAGWQELDGVKYYLVQEKSAEYDYAADYYPVFWLYALMRKDVLMRAIMRQGLEDEQDVVTAALVSARLAKTISKARVPVMDIDTGVVVAIEPVQFEDLLFQMIFGYYLRRLQARKLFTGGGNVA